MKEKIKQWFNQAVFKFERPLTRYAKNLLRTLPPAQEVVQDTFLKLWKHNEVMEEKPLKVWLFRTCRNHSIDIIRREGKMSSLTTEQEEELICPRELPSDHLEKKEIDKMISEMVSELPDKTQEVIRLKFQENLSYQEISEVTGHTSSQVGVILHRGILHLRAKASKGELA